MSFFLDLIISTFPAYIDKKQDNLNEIFFPNEFYYNKWNDFFNERKYKSSLESYLLISCDNKPDLCSKKHHNLWNLFFEVAMTYKKTSPQKYVSYLESSLEYYNDSLAFNHTYETNYNKEIVEKLLDEIESKKSSSWNSSSETKKSSFWDETDFKKLEERLEFLLKEENRNRPKFNKERQDNANTPFHRDFYDLFSMPYPNWASKSDFNENKRDF